nr:putative inactive leucine-rich repeat receptor-like protein kinase [Quercus suber]
MELGRSLKLLYAFLTLFLHLKPALGFTSGVGNGSVLCIEKERQTLLKFKKGFVEGNQGRLSSWGSEDEKNCCNWDGVYCNSQTGHVIELHLNSYGLRGGSIPDASGNMNSLQVLSLDENQLEGGIPKFFDGNQLKGSVPKSMGNLSALQRLHLGSNLLEGEISDQHFSNLSELVELSLSHNSLTSKFSNDWVPPFLLVTLDLSFCDLGPDFPKCECCKIAKDVSGLMNTTLSLKGLDNKKKHCARLRV